MRIALRRENNSPPHTPFLAWLQNMQGMLSGGMDPLGPGVSTITGPNRYRPPAGFMDEEELSYEVGGGQ
jgi:hypothetical protein